ncbi:type I-E CRISPR-associated endoribonuclease Cas2e [Atlantibacter hermannii]|uniref:type I-E CRISPR-associated endoribonuclease Cas2e n=1 Tax=Atlantibacter hermannii TaxID=565 RepID=UPI0005C1296D|nr:type I-E CRISPR-associated endoribonuclease Cas2e [Atlantibacter hermannii]KIU31056.1 CRISPR-associated protein Cas2 [Atlantibacter hermannii]
MIVVVANDLPPAVRGRMKLWFVEPKANVFVSGVKDAVANQVVDYLLSYCPPDAGGIIFKSLPGPPGYEIRTLGVPDKKMCEISGLQLVIEKLLTNNSI